MKSRSLFALSARASLLACVTLALASCAQNLYPTPQYNFAGRPIPPSKLLERVLVSLTANGSSGSLQIIDGLHDLRNNIQDTQTSFPIGGYSAGFPSIILNYPEQLRGYVYSSTDGSLTTINYSTEASTGATANLGGASTSVAVPPTATHVYSAQEQAGLLIVVDALLGRTFALNLPNVFHTVANRGDTVALAMTRNSNTLYRVIHLIQNTIYSPGSANPLFPPGAVDCQPVVLPVYCVVPVAGTFDRPADAYFSLDGNSVYVLNAGAEYGGGGNGGSGVSFLPIGGLTYDQIPNAVPYPILTTNTIPIPGGATTALADGTSLYIAGQSLQPDGLFTGNLTTLSLGTLVASAPVSISDGNHTKLLFADDNTLWIGSQFCANGERAAHGQNYNCLTRYDLGTHAASIVPAIAPATSTSAASVPYPNADQNLLYLGSLTGICWVQNYHKIYTAYGGQIHSFNTADGTERNNFYITVQGTALDVAYMDALTNAAN